ncbi:MAG: PAS domain S-box protein [Desulfobacterales bacterium]|jgi:PAS domain S-box-containing protein
MILKWIRKLGILKTTLVTSAVAIFSSFTLYAVSSYVIGRVEMRGILMSLIIPAIIAPILGYIFAYAVINLHFSQEALKQSEEKYKQLVNHVPTGIYKVDFNTGKLVSVNDVMCEYTGYTEKELLSMSALDFLTEESQKRFLARLDKLFKGEQIPGTVEYKARAKDGHEFWIFLDARYEYDQNGKPSGATVVAHDITDRKRAEEEKLKLEDQLQQAQKMEAVGTLAGGIAHDFNNILSVIIGYTELILMNGNVDSEVKQNLTEIFNASKHARDMVKQILAFSRQSKNERKPIQARHIVKEALKLLHASLPATIKIQQKLEKG